MTGLRIETSHLNQVNALPVEVNAEAFVCVIRRDMEPELLSRTHGWSIGIGVYH
jgi:hypothetical protein